MRPKKRKLIWINIAATVVTIGFNAYAQINELFGTTVGEVANAYPTMIVPAAYAFSIWSLIYLGLLAFSLYPLLFSHGSAFVDRVGYGYLIASLLNIFWILTWHARLVVVSAFLLLLLVASLVYIFLKLKKGKPESSSEKWFAHIPITIYLAWVSVASIVGVAVALKYELVANFYFTETVWASMMIVVAALLAIYVETSTSAIFFGITVSWALLGIYTKHEGIELIQLSSAFSIFFILLFSLVKIKSWARAALK